MWKGGNKKGWAPNNWCLRTVVLEKTLESPLDSKEIQPVHPKGDQSSIFIGRAHAEAGDPVFGYLMWSVDSLEKTLMLGKIEGRRKREQQRMRWLDDSTDSMDVSLSKLGDGEGQGTLVCYSPWGHKELDITDWLNNSNREDVTGHGTTKPTAIEPDCGNCWSLCALQPVLCKRSFSMRSPCTAN